MSGQDLHLERAALLLSTTDAEGRWLVPYDAETASEPRVVGRRLGEILTALSHLDSSVIRGALADQLWAFRVTLHDRLKAAGWRIKAKGGHGWTVLPPVQPRKR